MGHLGPIPLFESIHLNLINSSIMKPFITRASMKAMSILVLLCLMGANLAVNAQAKMPLISARFANPQIDQDAKQYFLDVEVNSATSQEVLFGMNIRFFYDASMLEFQGFDQFGPGYGLLLDEKPTIFRGNAESGNQMFDINGTASYVTGSVQMKDELFPLTLTPGVWTKVFRASFNIAQNAREGQFCPTIVWDLRPEINAGGFLPGSDGLLVTVAENNPATKIVSLPSLAKAEYFNWEYTQSEAMPFGRQVKADCISLGETVATDDPDKVDAHGYALLQNSPNPFQDRTTIEFILPVAQDASIKLYDESGKYLDEIKGHFKAGKNAVSIERKTWMEQSGIVVYQLETEGYKTEPMKMTLVQK